MNRIAKLKNLHLQSKPQLELFIKNVDVAILNVSPENLSRIVCSTKSMVQGYDSVIDELFEEIDRLNKEIEMKSTNIH